VADPPAAVILKLTGNAGQTSLSSKLKLNWRFSSRTHFRALHQEYASFHTSCRRYVMYARVTRFPGLPPERIKATLEHFKEEDLRRHRTGARAAERGGGTLRTGSGRPRVVDQQHGLPAEGADRLELPDVKRARGHLMLRPAQ